MSNETLDFSRREFMSTTLAAGLAMSLPVSAAAAKQNKRPICIFSKHLQWCKSYDEMAEFVDHNCGIIMCIYHYF